jgi:hypothetical protein
VKVTIIASAIWIVLFSQTCKVEEPKVKPVEVSSSTDALATKEMRKEEAIAIANKAALGIHRSLAEFEVVACEQSAFWAVIYDGDGSEYLIDKTSGRIVQVRRVPQGLADRNSEGAGPPKRIEGINEEEAVTIAKNSFRMTYGKEADKNLIIIPCELAKVWRIVFDVRLPRRASRNIPVIPDGHAPTYIIDKRTREVLYRQLY